jgi:hypothetical protein
LTFLRTTDTTEIQADASYGTQVYSNDTLKSLNQDIQNYSLRGLYKTERFDWSVSGNYSVAPTRNSALQSGGNFSANSSNTTWSVSPSVTYRLTELDSLVLSPSYSSTVIDRKTVDNQFRDYTIASVNLAWLHPWTERYTTTASWFYSNYDSQRGNFAGSTEIIFDSVGVNFSNEYKLSERWNLVGTIGGRHSQSTNGGVSSSSFGFLADTSATYTGENYSAGFSFSRSLAPSYQGFLQEITSFGVNYSYQISDNLTSSFGAGYQESTRVNASGQSDRKNIYLDPSISWHFLPEWTLRGSYQYRTQNRSSDNVATSSPTSTATDANLFMLSINYNWQGLKLSR